MPPGFYLSQVFVFFSSHRGLSLEAEKLQVIAEVDVDADVTASRWLPDFLPRQLRTNAILFG